MAGAKADFPDIFANLDFAAHRTVIVAVSGGSDSTALLLLLKSFLDRNAPATRPVAATVDHGLRPESAAEAKAVGRLCGALGIVHHVLPWTGDKPKTGLSAAARNARYRLLGGLAEREHAKMILTGHTADDQAETVLMRQMRGDGRGLAGIARATLHDGNAWIVRPLLGARRSELRDFLRLRGTAWMDDPSNENEAYERPRIRASFRRSDERDARVAEALAIAAEAAERRVALGIEAARLIEAHVSRPASGLLKVDREFARAGDPVGAVYALRVLLSLSGGTQQLPDEARVARLFARLGGGPFCGSLSRSVVDVRGSGIFLRREARDLPVLEMPKDGAVWDGRYLLSRKGGPDDHAVAAYGIANARKHKDMGLGVPDALVRSALAAEPALWRGGDCLDLLPAGVAFHGVEASPVIAPWAKFLPCFDLAVARASAELLGCAVIPGLPFVGHNETPA